MKSLINGFKVLRGKGKMGKRRMIMSLYYESHRAHDLTFEVLLSEHTNILFESRALFEVNEQHKTIVEAGFFNGTTSIAQTFLIPDLKDKGVLASVLPSLIQR